jgi:hypothetical protein
MWGQFTYTVLRRLFSGVIELGLPMSLPRYDLAAIIFTAIDHTAFKLADKPIVAGKIDNAIIIGSHHRLGFKSTRVR